MPAAALLLVLQFVSARDLTSDPAVRNFLWTLVQDARYGFAETEEAAFVVKMPEGHLRFVRWPPNGLHHEARWHGALPPNTVAIVHTHPNWLPEPSPLDIRAARRRRIPVYVVTRSRIVVTTGSETRVLVDRDWRPLGNPVPVAR